MPFLDRTFWDDVEAAVAQAEGRTSAELVVIVALQSGSYRDVAYLGGAAAATLTVALALFLPFAFHAATVLPTALVLFALGAWLSARLDGLVRLLTTARRRRRQVLEAARATFMEEAVHATRERTGVLFYVSLLERQVLVLPDLGVEAVVDRGALHALQRRMTGRAMVGAGARARFLSGLAECGALLADGLPPRADNPNELPDRPRLRS